MTDPLAAILRLARAPQRRWFRTASAMAAMAAIAAIVLLALSGWFIVAAALAGLAGVAAAQAFNYLLPSAAIRLLAIMRTGGRYGERLVGHQAALRALADVRVRLFRRMIAADVAAADRSSGDSATRLIQDVAGLEDQMVRGPGMTGAIVGLAMALLLVALADPRAALLSAVLVATALLLGGRLARKAAVAQQAVEQVQARLRRHLTEQLAAAGDIAAYGLSCALTDAMMEMAASGDMARKRLVRIDAAIHALALLAGAGSVGAVLSLRHAPLPVIILGALAAAGGAEMLAALMRARAVPLLRSAGRARLAAIADSGGPDPTAMPPVPANRITLPLGTAGVTLAAGDRIALSGRSGSGKTRLLETLAGWRDDPLPLSIDGRMLSPGTAMVRRPAFALAPQDAAILAGTIADNLRLARPGLHDDALWQALDTACLADDVRAMPHGLSTWVGDGGARLSGGQRKRLSLARALLADRPWLLLDEPSEGLDHETEQRLCARLRAWLDERGAGLILVTHRAGMLGLAQAIYEMA